MILHTGESHEKYGPENGCCLGYMSGMTSDPQLCGDYFINCYQDPVIKQSVVHGMG